MRAVVNGTHSRTLPDEFVRPKDHWTILRRLLTSIGRTDSAGFRGVLPARLTGHFRPVRSCAARLPLGGLPFTFARGAAGGRE